MREANQPAHMSCCLPACHSARHAARSSLAQVTTALSTAWEWPTLPVSGRNPSSSRRRIAPANNQLHCLLSAHPRTTPPCPSLRPTGTVSTPCVAAAADWGAKLISSRDGVGEDGWQMRRLEPEDRQHLTVLQLAGECRRPSVLTPYTRGR